MEYVLVIIMFYNGAGVTTAEFNSKESCNYAKQKLNEKTYEHKGRYSPTEHRKFFIDLTCIPKG